MDTNGGQNKVFSNGAISAPVDLVLLQITLKVTSEYFPQH